MEMLDPYGWHEISANNLEKVRRKLVNFESMTWQEILYAGSKRNKIVKVWTLEEVAQRRLKKLGQKDQEDIVELGIGSKERVWGILDQAVLRLLWWDPEHLVCPSPKKHT